MSFKILQCGTHVCPIVETIPKTSTLIPQASLSKFNCSEFGHNYWHCCSRFIWGFLLCVQFV